MSGSQSIKDFEILNKLGEGAYSQVFKVKRKSDGQIYALKKVKLGSLSQKEKENAVNEVRILASINDPNIVGYKEAFLDDIGTMCIVMEFAGGGDLYHKIVDCQKKKTFIPEAFIWRYLIQLLQGLHKLHSMKIFHRDLKTANIFLTADLKNVKLGDLNVSKVAKANLAYTQTGTPYYASPEVWRDEPYDHKSDMWSLGCVLYEIAAKSPPFKAESMEGLFRKVQKGIFDRIPPKYSDELNNIIKLCLRLTPKTRPDTDELLNNPIVKKKLLEDENIDLNLLQEESGEHLMGTIKVPKNITDLNKVLPKANYESKQENRPQSKQEDIKLNNGMARKLSNDNLLENKGGVSPLRPGINQKPTRIVSAVTPKKDENPFEKPPIPAPLKSPLPIPQAQQKPSNLINANPVGVLPPVRNSRNYEPLPSLRPQIRGQSANSRPSNELNVPTGHYRSPSPDHGRPNPTPDYKKIIGGGPNLNNINQPVSNQNDRIISALNDQRKLIPGGGPIVVDPYKRPPSKPYQPDSLDNYIGKAGNPVPLRNGYDKVINSYDYKNNQDRIIGNPNYQQKESERVIISQDYKRGLDRIPSNYKYNENNIAPKPSINVADEINRIGRGGVTPTTNKRYEMVGKMEEKYSHGYNIVSNQPVAENRIQRIYSANAKNILISGNSPILQNNPKLNDNLYQRYAVVKNSYESNQIKPGIGNNNPVYQRDIYNIPKNYISKY